MRKWRSTYPHLDEARVAAELSAWLAQPRTNAEIRARIRRYEGVTDDAVDARDLRPLAAAARPAAAGGLLGRQAAARASPSIRARCPIPSMPPRSCWPATWPRSAPRRGATPRHGPASPQRDFAEAWARLPTVAYRDERGAELLDLPGCRCRRRRRGCPSACWRSGTSRCWPTPSASGSSRRSSRPLRLTLSGDPTVTVDGRVAASWALRREATPSS